MYNLKFKISYLTIGQLRNKLKERQKNKFLIRSGVFPKFLSPPLLGATMKLTA